MKLINSARCLSIVFLCFCVLCLHAEHAMSQVFDIEIEPNRYIVHFTLPEYSLQEEDGNDYEEGNGEGGVDDGCGIFSEFVFEDDIDYDMTDVPGYPELPFFSLNLLLPQCASIVNVSFVDSITDQEFPSYLISPAALGSIVTGHGTYSERDELCYNAEYYTYGVTEAYPNGFFSNFYSHSTIYNAFNSTGVTLSVFPFSYHPEEEYINVLKEGVFIVEFNCGDLISTIDSVQTGSGSDGIARIVYYDTFNGVEITNNTGEMGNYLIIAARSRMETYLSPYVSYKQSQNFNTEVIYLDDYQALGNAERIRQLIYYNNVLPYPDYVLLVGNFQDIPASAGMDNFMQPYTDDNYHPYVGRWVISESFDIYGAYVDLRRIIDKTIQAEQGYANSYSSAVLFSGTDSKKRVSKQFYRNIKRVASKSFGRMDVPYTLYNGRDFSESQAQYYMQQALQSHPRFFIYRGHGHYTTAVSGIADPYWRYPGHVADFRNTAPTPMGFGFACGLNTYNTENSFGAKWVSESAGGGAAFYSATTASSRSSNNYLAKIMFKMLKKLTDMYDNFPLSVWLRLGENKYYWSLPNFFRGTEIAMYNLIGDPTLSVYGLDISEYVPFYARKEYVTENEQDGSLEDNHLKSIEVYSPTGVKLAEVRDMLTFESLKLDLGIYLVKETYDDGIVETEKLYK